MLRPPAVVFALALVVAGCDSEPTKEPAPADATRSRSGAASAPEALTAPSPVEIDFGTVPHGDQPARTVALDFGRSIAGYRISGFATGCSCARASFRLIDRTGETREFPAHGFHTYTLTTGDRLELELRLDTGVREVVDQQAELKVGRVVLSRGQFGEELLELPVRYRYAIDAPIAVAPVAHLDIGKLPRSRTYRDSLRLRFDPQYANATLGEPHATHAEVGARIELGTAPDGANEYRLHVTVQALPGSHAGPFLAHVEIPTSLDSGYTVRVPISGELHDDIVIQPMPHVSLGRCDLGEPAEQFVNLTDHDLDRPAAFEVAAITEFAEHFAVRFEPMADDRSHRMFIRYLGTCDPATLPGGTLRTEIRLRKPGSESPCATVTLVGFHHQKRP